MKLPTWFKNRLKTIMKHNDYPDDALTVAVCEKFPPTGKWTPCDLILREYYNNGCMSARGFLGLKPSECHRCYLFIKEHQEELRKMDYYSEIGYNNSGILLWANWRIR